MSTRDHNFTGTEKAEYDSLNHRGRTMYDDLRWSSGMAHADAYAFAVATHGLKQRAN